MNFSSRLCLAFLLSSSLIATGQQISSSVSPAQPATNASSFTPNSANRRLALDVVVTDKSGNPITGLQATDFTLLDDKHQQKIESFNAIEAATADAPVQIIFVVDEVNTDFRSVSFARQAMQKFLGQNGGHLTNPTSLVLFTDAGAKIQDGTSLDGNFLIGLLNKNAAPVRNLPRSGGAYAGQDEVQLSIRAMMQICDYESTRPGKKIVIWISPGWPYLSGPGRDIGLDGRKLVFQTITALSAELRESRITVYNISPLDMADTASVRTNYYQAFLKGVDVPKHAEIGNLALQVLAEQTGGRVLNSSNDVAEEIARCIREANAYYTISFDTMAANGPNEYHALQVKVDKPGLVAKTRMGYYNQP